MAMCLWCQRSSLRTIAAITHEVVIRRIRRHLKLAAVPLPIAPPILAKQRSIGLPKPTTRGRLVGHVHAAASPLPVRRAPILRRLESTRGWRGALRSVLWCCAKERMAAKVRTPAGRALYARRKVTVEPVCGQIKEARGFRRFLLRGLATSRGEWCLVCVTQILMLGQPRSTLTLLVVLYTPRSTLKVLWHRVNSIPDGKLGLIAASVLLSTSAPRQYFYRRSPLVAV